MYVGCVHYMYGIYYIEIKRRWVAKLVVGFESRHLSKIQTVRHKPTSGQQILADQKNIQKIKSHHIYPRVRADHSFLPITSQNGFINFSVCLSVFCSTCIIYSIYFLVGKVGGLQKIPQICELVRIRKCGHLRICDLRTKCFWQFADLRFADPVIFAYLKLPQIRKYIIYLLTNKSLKALIQIQGRLSGQF